MIYTPITLASGANAGSGPVEVYTPPAGGVILTRAVLANLGSVWATVGLEWYNGTRWIHLLPQVRVEGNQVLMQELYIPLLPQNKLRLTTNHSPIEYTLVGLGVS